MPNNTPKRPAITSELVLKALAGKCVGFSFTAEQFVSQYSRFKDSYEIARDMDRRYSCDLSREDLDDIDDMIGHVDNYHREVVKQWFAENDIQPPYAIGSTLTRGLITGIYEYEPATYLVKEPGCTNPTRSLLIKFEDAVLAEGKQNA
jgi:hypothetical protein